MTNPILVRKATPDDASEILRFLQVVTAEWPNNLMLSPGEVKLTVEEERKFIETKQERGLLLIALDATRVLGSLSLSVLPFRKSSHAASLGIVLHPEARGKGLGRRMILEAIECARSRNFKRIELNVFVRNEIAIALYTSLGFEIEGRKRCGIVEDGEYHDEYIMSLLL